MKLHLVPVQSYNGVDPVWLTRVSEKFHVYYGGIETLRQLRIAPVLGLDNTELPSGHGERNMFQVKRNGPNRLDITFGGKLDSDSMKAAMDELVTKADGIEDGLMLYEIGDFRIPTLGAIAVELSRIPQLFRFTRQFDRVAVLADKDWVKTVSEVEGALIPGLKIKAFDRDDKDDAERWLLS